MLIGDDARAGQVASEIATTIRAITSSKTETVRAVRRAYSKQLSKASAQFVIDVALRLLAEKGIHCFVAYELIQHHRAAATSLREKDLERLGRNLDEWSAVDCFACFLSGPAWRENQISDKVIHRWARSKDRWWRRVALVTTVPLNNKARGGSGDVERTLEVCRLLVDDRDDMVVKAMSWALRELSKRDSSSVRQFLREHGHAIASRVIREVNNKLSTGLKNPKGRKNQRADGARPRRAR